MRFPHRYIHIDGQWFIEDERGNRKLAEPDAWLDVLVGEEEWQMGAVQLDEGGKWVVYSNLSHQTWDLKSGQYAFNRLGPYGWIHPMRPTGKCICEVYRSDEDELNEQLLGTVIMDLSAYPIKRDLWIDNGVYILLDDRYFLEIDLKESIKRLGYDEDVFFWGC